MLADAQRQYPPGDRKSQPARFASRTVPALRASTEERRLECVFGEMLVPHDPPTHRRHHDRVTPDEQLKRGLIARPGEPRRAAPRPAPVPRPPARGVSVIVRSGPPHPTSSVRLPPITRGTMTFIDSIFFTKSLRGVVVGDLPSAGQLAEHAA